MPAPIVLLIVLQYDDLRKTFASLDDAEAFVRRYLPLLPDKVWDEDPDGAVVSSYEWRSTTGKCGCLPLSEGQSCPTVSGLRTSSTRISPRHGRARRRARP